MSKHNYCSKCGREMQRFTDIVDLGYNIETGEKMGRAQVSGVRCPLQGVIGAGEHDYAPIVSEMLAEISHVEAFAIAVEANALIADPVVEEPVAVEPVSIQPVLADTVISDPITTPVTTDTVIYSPGTEPPSTPTDTLDPGITIL